jgi:GH25 family lysozyme M1 (1,4-beta-N-acetylmuramidase)
MTNKAKGIDVSSWQHPNGRAIDWEEVYADGWIFALVKVTQGAGYTNPWGKKDISDARAAGLLVGAYHYFDAGVAAPPQALNFVGQLVGEHLDLGAYVDWECYAAEPYSHTVELNECRAAAGEHLGEVGIYCDLAWAEILGKESVKTARWWLAHPGDVAPAGAFIWQDSFASTVPGVPVACDTDVLTTTRAVNLPTAPAPKPTAADDAKVVALARPVADYADAAADTT